MESIETPPPPNGSIFTAILISMVGILATSLAVVLYHLIIVKYCLRSQTDPRPLLAAASTRMSTGVDAETLETIPILTYSKQKGLQFHADDQSECAVCLAELEDDDIVRLLPSCRHAFHITCIDEWFISHTNCPVCRTPVKKTALIVSSTHDQEGNGLINQSGSDLVLQLLRRAESCVLPMDGIGKSRPVNVMAELKLKRSFSMGHYYSINIDIQRERESEIASAAASSSSSSSKAIVGRSRSYRARSMRQLDRASSSLRRSLSRLRMGFGGSSNHILPY